MVNHTQNIGMTDHINVSVVLCSHNSNPDYLSTTLSSLRRQSLPVSRWELVVVDNGSREPLEPAIDLSWHLNARVVREEKLGLSHARRRGYVETSGALIVHSDDDNILQEDYLEQALAISNMHPCLGTFGGQVIPEYDVPPKTERQRQFQCRKFDKDRWSNLHDDNRTMPFGAGMCLRREVVDTYLQSTEKDPRRLMIGRAGNGLLTGEDIDLNWVATSMGLGTGLFQRLKLQHFTPIRKISDDHILRYAAGNAYSMVILHFLHFGEIKVPKRSLMGNLAYWLRTWLRMDSFSRKAEQLQNQARKDAVHDLQKWGWLKEYENVPQ